MNKLHFYNSKFYPSRKQNYTLFLKWFFWCTKTTIETVATNEFNFHAIVSFKKVRSNCCLRNWIHLLLLFLLLLLITRRTTLNIKCSFVSAMGKIYCCKSVVCSFIIHTNYTCFDIFVAIYQHPCGREFVFLGDSKKIIPCCCLNLRNHVESWLYPYVVVPEDVLHSPYDQK
jgi:hypothetical protein